MYVCIPLAGRSHVSLCCVFVRPPEQPYVYTRVYIQGANTVCFARMVPPTLKHMHYVIVCVWHFVMRRNTCAVLVFVHRQTLCQSSQCGPQVTSSIYTRYEPFVRSSQHIHKITCTAIDIYPHMYAHMLPRHTGWQSCTCQSTCASCLYVMHRSDVAIVCSVRQRTSSRRCCLHIYNCTYMYINIYVCIYSLIYSALLVCCCGSSLYV